MVRAAKAASGTAPIPDNNDHIARRYHSLVIDGRLKATVRFATDCSGGGVLAPADIDAKSGKTVVEVLRSKHPKARRPELEKEDWASFEEYPTPREGVPLDCDQGILQVVAGKLSGSAGPNSVNGIALKCYLLNYKEHSLGLREEMALWVEFLANKLCRLPRTAPCRHDVWGRWISSPGYARSG